MWVGTDKIFSRSVVRGQDHEQTTYPIIAEAFISKMWRTDLYKYSPDAAPPIHAVSYHVATNKPPAQNGDKFRSILATVCNQSQLAERKHVARYWSINTAATAVPLIAHPFPVVIYNEISDGHIGRAVVRRRCSAGLVAYCPVSEALSNCNCNTYMLWFTKVLSGPECNYSAIVKSLWSRPQICINIFQMPYLLFNMYHLM